MILVSVTYHGMSPRRQLEVFELGVGGNFDLNKGSLPAMTLLGNPTMSVEIQSRTQELEMPVLPLYQLEEMFPQATGRVSSSVKTNRVTFYEMVDCTVKIQGHQFFRRSPTFAIEGDQPRRYENEQLLEEEATGLTALLSVAVFTKQTPITNFLPSLDKCAELTADDMTKIGRKAFEEFRPHLTAYAKGMFENRVKGISVSQASFAAAGTKEDAKVMISLAASYFA